MVEFVGNSVKLGKLLLVTPDGYLRISLTELTAALQTHGIEAGLGKVMAKADPLLLNGEIPSYRALGTQFDSDSNDLILILMI